MSSARVHRTLERVRFEVKVTARPPCVSGSIGRMVRSFRGIIQLEPRDWCKCVKLFAMQHVSRARREASLRFLQPQSTGPIAPIEPAVFRATPNGSMMQGPYRHAPDRSEGARMRSDNELRPEFLETAFTWLVAVIIVFAIIGLLAIMSATPA